MERTALDCALDLSLDQIAAALIERGALASGASVCDDFDLRESEPDDLCGEELGWEDAEDVVFDHSCTDHGRKGA